MKITFTEDDVGLVMELDDVVFTVQSVNDDKMTVIHYEAGGSKITERPSTIHVPSSFFDDIYQLGFEAGTRI